MTGTIGPTGPAGTAVTLDLFTTGTTKTVTFTSNRTVTIASSTTAGAKTVTIPAAAAGNSGFEWTLKTTLSNGVLYTVSPASGTIDGASSFVFADNAQDSITAISNGSGNWMVI